ncbi:DUF6221 family protein [Streptomyces spinosisporus]|uniref:DUF6221 family protein n=1 Tax=Streptomyces spinosisporus TaxID=2927582 RepID=A0ABS9XDY5_9ACTN|nr:DUF6221 family protein [Streptomyces spinosisporus]MCI3240266.1 DUF6221 family protein [Streptomyces spinosisporus]
MDDLVQWLRAQLDEDERIARAAGGTWWAPPDLPGEVYDSGGVNIDAKLKSFAAHIAEHDPARVLREIDAKRRMLELHHSIELPTEALDACAECEVTGAYPEYPCRTLRLLALPYSDRPGYREEWRP